jgi:multiple sugar transport system substrate-binding protein
MKKILFCLVIVGLLAIPSAIFAGGEQEEGGVKTIEYVYYGNAKTIPLLEEMIAGFADNSPDINVEFTAYPATSWREYFNKIATRVAGGAAPDVCRISSQGTRLFADMGLAIPLDEFIERDKDQIEEFYADVDQNLLDTFRYKDQVWAFPFEWNDYFMYYNTEHFKDNGFGRPADDWNKDDFLEIAQKLTIDTNGDNAPDRYGYCLDTHTGGQFGAGPWIFNWGTNILNDDWTESNFDDPKVIEAWEWMQDLVNKYEVCPDPITADQFNYFSAEKVSMCVGGRWPVISFEAAEFYDYDIIYFPKVERQITQYGVGGFTMVKGTKHPDAAWELIKFLTEPEPIAIVTGRGASVPARRSQGFDPAIMAQQPPEHWRLFYEGIENSLLVPSPTCWTEMDSINIRYLSLVMANEMDAETAALKCHEEVSALLAKDS